MEGPATGLGCCDTALPLRLQGPAEAVVLNVSVADKEATLSLWQVPRVVHSAGPLDLGSKILPSYTNNYSPLEK